MHDRLGWGVVVVDVAPGAYGLEELVAGGFDRLGNLEGVGDDLLPREVFEERVQDAGYVRRSRVLALEAAGHRVSEGLVDVVAVQQVRLLAQLPVADREEAPGDRAHLLRL